MGGAGTASRTRARAVGAGGRLREFLLGSPSGKGETQSKPCEVPQVLGWGCRKAARFVLDCALLQGRHCLSWAHWHLEHGVGAC